MEDQPAVKRTFDLRLTDGHVEYILTQAEKFQLCIWKDGGRMSYENYSFIGVFQQIGFFKFTFIQ